MADHRRAPARRLALAGVWAVAGCAAEATELVARIDLDAPADHVAGHAAAVAKDRVAEDQRNARRNRDHARESERGAQSAADAGPAGTVASPSAITVERVPFATAREYLWPAGPPDTRSCETARDPIACLLSLRWSGFPEANTTVNALWRDLGIVCGVERAHVMNGSYRGMVSIVPEMPVARYAQHLAWVDQSLRDQDAYYRTIANRAPRPIAYRWTGLGILFFRSVHTRTPAGYAEGWDFAYNVVGGINDSLERIRTTIVHEVFHLNDGGHGWWSHSALQPIYETILRRCGRDMACLRQYAPMFLRVRRTGMYYAFQPGNSGVGEYAAMLAERFYLEQSGQWHEAPFRCGPSENAAAWRAISEEFFGGLDASSPCPR